MKLFLLIAWGGVSFAVFMVTVLTSIGDSDRDGRVAMPGKVVVTLEAGDYGVWYEEPHSTCSNCTFEPPGGIAVSVVGVENEPDPVLDLGGLGNQVGTGNRTAETIGKLTVAEAGKYRLVAGPPPSGAAAITLGASGSESFLLAAKRVGWISVAFALLLLLVVIRQRTRPPKPTAADWIGAYSVGVGAQPATPVIPALPGIQLSAQDVLDRGVPGQATVLSATPMAMSAPDGAPVHLVSLQVHGGQMVLSGQRVPAGQGQRLTVGSVVPVKVDPQNPQLVAIDW